MSRKAPSLKEVSSSGRSGWNLFCRILVCFWSIVAIILCDLALIILLLPSKSPDDRYRPLNDTDLLIKTSYLT